jgi:hypothetical protein
MKILNTKISLLRSWLVGEEELGRHLLDYLITSSNTESRNQIWDTDTG